MTSLPLSVPEMPVARGPRLIGHYGGTATENTVEKRGLSNVGPADNRNRWLAHAATGI
jgi:hypothetical protein